MCEFSRVGGLVGVVGCRLKAGKHLCNGFRSILGESLVVRWVVGRTPKGGGSCLGRLSKKRVGRWIWDSEIVCDRKSVCRRSVCKIVVLTVVAIVDSRHFSILVVDAHLGVE